MRSIYTLSSIYTPRDRINLGSARTKKYPSELFIDTCVLQKISLYNISCVNSLNFLKQTYSTLSFTVPFLFPLPPPKFVYVVTPTRTTVLPDRTESLVLMNQHFIFYQYMLLKIPMSSTVSISVAGIYKYLHLEIVIFYTFSHHLKAFYKLLFC